MAKQVAGQDHGADPGWAITLLSVSPAEADHRQLRSIFIQGDWARQSDFSWRINAVLTFVAAVSALHEETISIVLCESELLPGTWKELLGQISALPDPPLMIVTSRHADEYLWAEALNLGAYDVLSKPFDIEETRRVLTTASLHWSDRPRRRYW